MAERGEKMGRLLSPTEVKDILGIGRTTMYKMIRNGEIPALKIGRKWRILESNLRKWLQGQGSVVLLKPCWEIRECSDRERRECSVFKDLTKSL